MRWNRISFVADKYVSLRRFLRVKERSVQIPFTFLNPEWALAASYSLKMKRPESLLIPFPVSLRPLLNPNLTKRL